MDNNFEVKDEEIEKKLRFIGSIIKKQLPKELGFTLMLFDYGEKGNMFYISSAQREDMIKAMKEFIAKNEKQPE
jgi:hypothetical protein